MKAERPMRILCWSENFWPLIGGAEVFASNLLVSLQERGYEILVITSDNYDELPAQGEYRGLRIRRLAFHRAIVNRDVEAVMDLIKRTLEEKEAFCPDLVHVHGIGPSVFFHLETAKRHPAPSIVTLISEFRGRSAFHPLHAQVVSSADWITAKSATTLIQLREKMEGTTNRASVIYNGIETPNLPLSPPAFDPPTLLCVGRLDYQKGFDLALAVMPSILERFPDVRLEIAGDGHDKAELERKVKDLDLESNVTFLGWVSPNSIPELMNRATVVLMPSRWEGHPSVALQAAIMARPVVAARVGALAEIIRHDETGLLVQPENTAALSQAILELLHDPQRAVALGRAGRLVTQGQFSLQQCVDAYDRLYQMLIALHSIGWQLTG